jgi:hypothetical protein
MGEAVNHPGNLGIMTVNGGNTAKILLKNPVRTISTYSAASNSPVTSCFTSSPPE